MGETIHAEPKRTERARTPRRIIDPFFVWATKNAIREGGMRHIVFLEKIDDLRIDRFVISNVARGHGPFPQRRRFLLRLRKNSDDQFGRLPIVRSVGRDRGERIFCFGGGTHARTLSRSSPHSQQMRGRMTGRPFGEKPD